MICKHCFLLFQCFQLLPCLPVMHNNEQLMGTAGFPKVGLPRYVMYIALNSLYRNLVDVHNGSTPASISACSSFDMQHDFD